MSLFCLDIGNTNVVLGLYDGEKLLTHWRIATDPHKMADEYAMLILDLFERSGHDPANVQGVIVASVVPPLTGILEKLCQRYFGQPPLLVEAGLHTGVPIRYDAPHEVGADRVVNAVAAYRRYGGPACVVDFGTATTFDALSAAGEYLGGAIAPGIGIAAEALFQRTAKLPRIDLVRPPAVIGKNTVQSMQSGMLFGYVGLVEGLVARFRAELGPEMKVIATGGLAALVAAETDVIDAVDPWLTLEGLRLIWEMNRPAADAMRNRAAGVAVGAAMGDALGMPLEFGPRRALDRLVREMEPGRLPAGTFTDDTEMALALADSLLAHQPLALTDLARRFAAWLQAGPDDIGLHTRNVLSRIAAGEPWEQAVQAVQRHKPDSAGNGSVMRCWPVALAHWDDPDQLLADSRLQSRVTHPHPECEAGSAFVNTTIYYLLQGRPPAEAVAQALAAVDMPAPLRAVIEQAPTRRRDKLQNSGWVRHTIESAVWGLLTTHTFEEALVQVVNLGNDADTAGAVVGALAGAAYGLDVIPLRWRQALQGEWPLGSGRHWSAQDLADLAIRLLGR